jgi:hypothetical protein
MCVVGVMWGRSWWKCEDGVCCVICEGREVGIVKTWGELVELLKRCVFC